MSHHHHHHCHHGNHHHPALTGDQVGRRLHFLRDGERAPSLPRLHGQSRHPGHLVLTHPTLLQVEDELHLIFKVLGTPTEDNWPGISRWTTALLTILNGNFGGLFRT